MFSAKPMAYFLTCGTFILALFAGPALAFEVALPHQRPLAVEPEATVHGSRVLALTARIHYTNSGDLPARITHSVTVPAMDTTHQRVLSVTTDADENAELLRHANGVDRYLRLNFPLPAHSELTRYVKFVVRLQATEYHLKEQDGNAASAKGKRLALDVDPRIHKLAESAREECGEQTLCALRKVFVIPRARLKFRKSALAVDAVTALERGVGDCTEYAALFVALAHALDVPARGTALFNMAEGAKIRLKMPNHNAAEIYWPGLGWIPADPNLGVGGMQTGEGLGKRGVNTVLYARAGAWAWANRIRPRGLKVQAEMEWDAEFQRDGEVVKP